MRATAHIPATYHPRLELVEVQKALKHMVKPGADGEQATPVVGFPPEFTTESGEVRPPRARLRARARARSPACPPARPPAHPPGAAWSCMQSCVLVAAGAPALQVVLGYLLSDGLGVARVLLWTCSGQVMDRKRPRTKL